MSKSELLFTKFVGKDTTRRTTPGIPSHIYRDILPWSKRSRNHMSKMLRNQMVAGESCQCIRHTRQKNPCEVGVRHAVCTVTECAFVVRYQNTSNLEQHYIRGGTDHKELADRLAAMQQLERQDKLGSAEDGRMVLSRTFNPHDFTSEKKALCDMKFVKCLVRKSRALTMGSQDDELNGFIEEVTDGEYTLPYCEVILKLVKQMQAWGDVRIKK
jgi:hypothetical protein